MSDQNNSNSQSSDQAPQRPLTPAPTEDAGRIELVKKQLRDTKPTTMVSQSVNKTALHPSGVQ